ncbi:MAG: ABC transporter permease subunit [Limnobacter sp.]|nr:ABC transporter permease subunit [Limnobacter sp.]
MNDLKFSFLNDPAGFSLSESFFALTAQSQYTEVIIAGLINTLKVAIPSLVLCSLLGLLIGLGRLSHAASWRWLCNAYVGLVRNVPMLLQLLAIYFAITRFLPIASEAWSWNGWVFLSKSGLALPTWAAGEWVLPQQGRFAVEATWVLSPEYLAVLLALSIYTSAFVAEIVRAGVQSVPQGLVQASWALGLNKQQTRREVVLPVALRLIVPALSNQYLNLLKNASLGVAVGYPELVSVSNTAMNQSGRVIECVLIVMVLYAALSLLTAWVMNQMNQRVNRGAL